MRAYQNTDRMLRKTWNRYMVKHLLITITLLLALFAGCQNIHRAADKKIGTIITEKIMDGTIEIPELLVQQRISYYFAPLLVSTFAGIFLIFARNKIGYGILVASIATIVLLIVLTLYIKYVAIAGGVLMLIGCYYTIRHLKDQNRFQLDAVKSVDKAMELIPVDKIDRLKDRLRHIQSDTTKIIVDKIKKTINK